MFHDDLLSVTVKMSFDKNLLYVIVASFATMFIIAAAQTFRNIQKVFMESISEDEKNYKVEAYYVFATIYIVLAFALWLAPCVINVVGAKWSMIFGALTYQFMVFQFLFIHDKCIYIFAIILGFGAAILSVGVASYIRRNSDSKTIARNTRIFWGIFQLSAFLGHTFIYLEFRRKEEIDHYTRNVVIYVLGGWAALGTLILIFLPRRKQREEEVLAADIELGFLQNLKWTKKILRKDNKMRLLCVTSLYTGISMAFYASIHSSCIAFTREFAGTKKLLGMSALLTGVGQMIGGLLFGSMAYCRTNHCPGFIVILIGITSNLVAYIVAFLNLPSNCPFRDTTDASKVTHRDLSLFASILLGLGDSCFETQLQIILGRAYTGVGTAAFGLNMFIKHIGVAAAFFYAPFLILDWQLLILSIFGVVGTGCFLYADWSAKRQMQRDSLEDTMFYMS